MANKEWFKIVSISQEDSYRECGWRYYLERVKKVPRIETVEQAFGSGMHAALALFNKSLRCDTWLPFDMLIWAFRDAFGRDRMTTYWEYRARKLLSYYLDAVAPVIGKPLLVEEQFYIDLSDRLPWKEGTRYILTGILDLLTVDGVLHDYKVVKKIRTIQGVMQEACYREGIERMIGKPPRAICRVHILRESDPAEILRDWMQVEQKDIDEFWDRMIAFVGQLRRRVYMKNPESRWCHPRWCPHYGTLCDPERKPEVVSSAT
jgi:hypothetical protein